MTVKVQSLRFAIAACALLIGTPVVAFAYSGQNLAPQAKITMEQARSIALGAVSGKITDQELENEGGGSGLRYSFDIKHNGKTYEVGVDAKTGAVLEHKAEGPHPG